MPARSGEASAGYPAPSPTALPAPAGRFRWTVCALLFFATTVNYVDRQILGLLAPVLQKDIGWTELQYGFIVTAFQAAYALGLALFGRFIDRRGTRRGYAVSIVSWSLAAAAHALVRTPFGFGAARAALGLAEGGNFPAAIKAVAEWFPKKDRALATGLFNSGTNFGAVFGPAVVPWLTQTFGWPAAFVATGALGFVWLVFWLLLYDRPERKKGLDPGELAYILSDPPEPAAARVPWRTLFRYRQTWAFVIGKFLTDPVWWFYLYWLAKFLNSRYGLSLTELSGPLVAIYAIASLGSVGGGWLSSRLIRRGVSVNRARKAVMLGCALLVTPVATVSRTADLWTAVLLIGLAGAAHQGWSANIFTTASDMFPKRAVGSVVGLGGTAGAAGGLLFASFVGYILQRTGNNYLVPFLISGSAYLVAFAVIQALAPRLAPAALDEPGGRALQ